MQALQAQTTAFAKPVAEDVYLTAPQTKARFGGISDMTLWRWLADDKLSFPQPIVVNRRRLWRLFDLEAWERRQAARREAA